MLLWKVIGNRESISDSVSRVAFCRHPLFKVWKKAMISEIPKLVWNSNISSELKPEIKFVEIVKTEGGFISGVFVV